MTTLGLAIGLTLGVSGCASGGMLAKMPAAIGGEPADLPAAPKTPYKYPAVHDMPPPRATKPLTDNEQIKLEKELEAARDRLENKAGSASKAESAPKAAQTTKKKPAAGKAGANDSGANGSSANGSSAKTNP